MSCSQPIHPTEERLFLAACLAYLKRADGSQPKDWSLAETAHRSSSDLLRKYWSSPQLTDALTERAYAALEDLRQNPAIKRDWFATQAQAGRVLPVVMQLLHVLSTA